MVTENYTGEIAGQHPEVHQLNTPDDYSLRLLNWQHFLMDVHRLFSTSNGNTHRYTAKSASHLLSKSKNIYAGWSERLQRWSGSG
jgi:hypothetical protein